MIPPQGENQAWLYTEWDGAFQNQSKKAGNALHKNLRPGEVLWRMHASIL